MNILKSFPWIINVFAWFKQTVLYNEFDRALPGRAKLLAFLALWFSTGGRIVVNDGRVVVYAPDWFYKLMCLVFWPTNWIITFVTSRALILKQNKPDWPLDPALTPAKLRAATPEQLATIKATLRLRTRDKFDENQLMQLFDSLPGPRAEDMLCNFRGKVVHTGSLLDVVDDTLGRLDLLGLGWGKRYRSQFIGDPLVFNFWDRIFVPVPVWGNVGLPEIQYRGKVNATMVYDYQPWQDHFRVLSDGSDGGKRMILGLWASHEKIGGWFTLEALGICDRATAHMHRLNGPSTYA